MSDAAEFKNIFSNSSKRTLGGAKYRITFDLYLEGFTSKCLMGGARKLILLHDSTTGGPHIPGSDGDGT